MLTSTEELHGYSLGAADGEIGSVQDFYFDDSGWTIRYLAADTRKWLVGRPVLISTMAVGRSSPEDRRMYVELNKDQVKKAPDMDTRRPISREQEIEFHNYYGLPYYWEGIAAPASFVSPWTESTATRTAAGDRLESRKGSNLRSVREVMGYHIQATDDEVGHVEDFIIDDQSWRIRCIVVRTSNWWSGKKVLISTEWIERISWNNRRVAVGLTGDQINNGPEWDEIVRKVDGTKGGFPVTSCGNPRDEPAPEPSDETLTLLPLDSEVAEVIYEDARKRVRHYLQEFALARATGWGTRRLPGDDDPERT